MNVLFEVLSNTTIENVITCLNFKFKKIVFFGFKKNLESMQAKTSNFLKKYCKVSDIDYCLLSTEDPNSIFDEIELQVINHKNEGNDIFVDVTGGEDISLLMLGKVAYKHDLSIHYYDLYNDKLYDINNKLNDFVSKSKLKRQNIKLNIDMILEANGMVINYDQDKSYQYLLDDEFEQDIYKISRIIDEYNVSWTKFTSEFYKGFDYETSVARITKDKYEELKFGVYSSLIEALRDEGIVYNIENKNNTYSFRFKNDMIKRLFLDGGAVLEYLVFFKEKSKSDDIKIGAHIDWDGIITGHNDEVVNEIDVITLNSYHLTFISCKAGKLDILKTYYELYALARRLGDKYTKKVLVTKQEVTDTDLLRAKEMGITVIYKKDL